METIATKKTLECSIHAAVATQRPRCNLVLMEFPAAVPHTSNDVTLLPSGHLTAGQVVRNRQGGEKTLPQ